MPHPKKIDICPNALQAAENLAAMVGEATQAAIAQKLAPVLARYFGVDASRVQLDSGFGEPRILCSGSTLRGSVCNRRATSFAEDTGYCYSHIPHRYRGQNLPGKPEAILKGGFRQEWEACRRIISIYLRASLFRDVPPPEELAFHLLRALQGGSCLTCPFVFQYPNETDINRDHDHKTGMVRSLLCVRCNRREDARPFSLMWEVYRLFAPANGWHYRYMGPHNAQWSGCQPDPVDERLRCAKIFETAFARNPEVWFPLLEEVAKQKQREGYTFTLRPYRFDPGNKLVWLDE